MSSEIKEINIDKLHFNLDNPRFPKMDNETAIINSMLEDQGNKLVQLAKHILGNGLNPNELPIAMQLKDRKGHYYLLDGNRRLTVLKFLNNIELIPSDPRFHNLKKHFYTLSMGNNYEKLPCNVFTDINKAWTWVELKHTGENKGAGTAMWNAQQTSNFAERVRKDIPIEMQLLNYLKNIGFEQKYNLDLSAVPSSSLKRLVSDKYIKERLGLFVNDKRLETNVSDAELEKPFVKILEDLSTNKISVKNIYHKIDRELYLQSFSQEQLPNKEAISSKRSLYIDEIGNIVSPVKAFQQDLLSDTDNKDSDPRSKIRSNKSSTYRDYLIPNGCSLKISNPKINSIYKELKCLPINKFPNSGAVLLRVFLEFSLDGFREKYLPNLHKSSNLQVKLCKAREYLVTNKHLTEAEVKGISVGISDPNSILSIHTFHAYVHNPNMTPIANDLKISWDNMQIFILKLWELI